VERREKREGRREKGPPPLPFSLLSSPFSNMTPITADSCPAPILQNAVLRTAFGPLQLAMS
jgi:hypothetical protein